VAARRLQRDPLDTLRITRQQALALAQEKGVAKMRKQLMQAQRELNLRLQSAIQGPGEDSFTAHQIRVALEQVRATLAIVKGGMRKTTLETGKLAAEDASTQAVRYIAESQAKYVGIGQKLGFRESRVLDRAIVGTESSLLNRLQGDPKAGPGILDRYGDNVIRRFEERLQQRFIQKKPWNDVRNELIAESPFLQQAPGYWAERIVRTEVMGAHNRANWETMRAVNDEVGEMLKILSATFDSRTASDSYAVHGQIRRVNEAFEDWYHMYQHPPNRPNDREVVVPHRMNWPIPPNLAWRSDSEVSAKWAEEGRKGSPPPRPRMTTVPLERIGAVESRVSTDD